MYDDVLFPTDGGDATDRALRHAIDLAGRYGATLHALSVVTGDPYRADERDADAAAGRAVETAADRARGADVEARTAVREGTPHEEILAYVDEHGVDVIVMGTHGRTGVERALLGSVTEQVVRTADVPVLTVRATDEPTVTDADEAVALARDALRDRGHADARVADDPARTTGTWIVPYEADGTSGHVHINAMTGHARVAERDPE